MQTRRGFRSKLALLLMLATASAMSLPWIPRQEASSLNRTPLPAPLLPPAEAVADFDGDRLPDRAELVSYGFQKDIRLTLSSRRAPSLRFPSDTQQPGGIYAKDIDRDSDEDLIWVSDGQPDHAALWLNNGGGELARNNNLDAYDTEIKSLVAGDSRNGSLASFVRDGLKAAANVGFYFPALVDNHLTEIPNSTLPKSPHRSRAPALSPGVSHYPKRGPPSFLS
jgi:hypothetical protein